MKLSKRLETLLTMIDPCETLADIGCDHALLAIAAILNKKCNYAYACDINPLPLEGGKQAIIKHGLTDCIETCLSDGLLGLDKQVDCIVIAGMGYENIKGILQARMDYAYQAKQIILQANLHVDLLRLWLMKNDFMINQEILVKDGKHYYQLLSIAKGKMILDSSEQLMGVKVKTDDVYLEYWQMQLAKKAVILNQIESSNPQYGIIKAQYLIIKNKLEKISDMTYKIRYIDA